jgi:hypothetical protein
MVKIRDLLPGDAVVRAIRAVLAGVGVAAVLVLAIESIGLPIFPQPTGMDPLDPESVRQHLSEIHPGSFVMVLLAWTTAAFAGPWVARRISRPSPTWPPFVVAALFTALCAVNLIRVPTPAWLTVSAIALVPLATWLGLRRAA